MAGKIHIGISGWSYADWKGLFYPPQLKSTDWLQYYAGFFHTTEINASFYHLPKADTILKWSDKVPASFRFCPKMNKYLTHILKLKNAEEPLDRFFNVFAPIKKKLGPILLQLPPSLKFDTGLARDFFAVLKDKWSDYHFALEARHDSWLAPEAFGLMEQYNIAWAISQSGVGFPYKEAVTARNIYVRFHGPAKLYASVYTDHMLQHYSKLFDKWSKANHTIWAYFNNCYYGVAIDNANTLRRLLGVEEDQAYKTWQLPQ